MAFKAINDLAGPNSLIPTLLVFRAYPRIIKLNIIIIAISTLNDLAAKVTAYISP